MLHNLFTLHQLFGMLTKQRGPRTRVIIRLGSSQTQTKDGETFVPATAVRDAPQPHKDIFTSLFGVDSSKWAQSHVFFLWGGSFSGQFAPADADQKDDKLNAAFKGSAVSTESWIHSNLLFSC